MNDGMTDTWLMLVLAAATGLIFGSFLNVVIHRGPAMWGLVEDHDRQGNLLAPGSYCPACKAPLRWFELIPLLSYMFSKGQCRRCGHSIALRYPVVETLGGAAAVLAVAAFGVSANAVFALLFLFPLIALGFIDLETGYLPDALTLPLLFIGLAANAVSGAIPIADAIIGAIVGFAAFRGIAIGFQKLRGREGLGAGDAKLLAAIGAWLGWYALPFVVLIAALSTLIIWAFVSLSSDSTPGREIPFGPGLCAAATLVFAYSVYAPFTV